MGVQIVETIALIFVIFLVIQAIRCYKAVRKSQKRLKTYHAKTAHLSYGNMTYIDQGQGEVLLVSHGIFGGFDQAYETCKQFRHSYRILAPSRFGYLGSDTLGNASPTEQARAYTELLNHLGIKEVYILGTSAGGAAAIRFALDYPKRAKGLILYCSAMPFLQKPEHYAEYAGPPAFLCSNFGMFFLSPFFETIMGLAPSTIYSMLPVHKRKAGIILDAKITNPDMARNFENYQIERLKMPTLIFQAKDDKLVSYQSAKDALNRFPAYTLVDFEKGGHLMTGHDEEIGEQLIAFIEANH